MSNFGLIVLFALALLAFVLVGPLLCFLQCYLYTWHFRPFFWPTDMYEKVLYLAHVYSMRGRKEPIAGAEWKKVAMCCEDQRICLCLASCHRQSCQRPWPEMT